MSQSFPDWLPEKVAAQFIGKTLAWMRATRAAAPHRVPPWYRIGGQVKYKRDELVEWIEGRRGK